MDEDKSDWVRLIPELPGGEHGLAVFRRFIEELLSTLPDTEAVRNVRERISEEFGQGPELDHQPFRVAIAIVSDLRMQGWEFRVDEAAVWIRQPQPDPRSPMLEKSRVRTAHLRDRTSQLLQPPVREFIESMERRRPGPRGWISIYSLMRDGRDLAARLRKAVMLSDGPKRWKALTECVDPYLQFVEPDSICELTGLRLGDVWRYFSYTWTNVYRGVPGRRMWVLVRDRAASNHPVIGIAAIASSIVQLTPRDRWIGWTASEFLERLRREPTRQWAVWLDRSLGDLIQAFYVKDFLEEGLVSRRDLRAPTEEAVARLLKEAQGAREHHRLFPQASAHKSAPDEGTWEVQARTQLFRAKRAEDLAQLLDAKRRLLRVGFTKPRGDLLEQALGNPSGRRAIEVVLRHVKAAHVGVNMLDIVVCGAVPPYNTILGGKLVSLLMGSPEVIDAYEKRYADSESIIASSMAGRPIRRRPQLVTLNTTSLYGVASSQYNRLSIPAEAIGGRRGEVVRFERLGRTVGFGSFHLSRETVGEIEQLLARSQKGRPVNSLFGEGVNPRMRKIRAGLDAIGLPSDVLLRHGSPRLVYGINLASNFREVLLGKESRPRYIIPRAKPEMRSARIAAFWMRRWLSRRIESDELVQEVERHTMVYPIEHGARVILPEIDDDQLPLEWDCDPDSMQEDDVDIERGVEALDE